MGQLIRLFGESDLRAKLEERAAAMAGEVRNWGEQQVLGTSATDLSGYLAQKYLVEPLVLREAAADHEEEEYDARRDSGRYVSDRSRPCLIPGTRYFYRLPYQGGRLAPRQ